MTQYEKMISTSKEEMAMIDAQFFDCDFCPHWESCEGTRNCFDVWLDWLDSEVEDGNK